VLGIATAEGVAFIGGAATIIAAVILGGWAAWGAESRLKVQIKDAGDRLRLELAGEAERQAATLAHDRELADLADLRKLLDEATVALDRARDVRSEAGAAIRGAIELESRFTSLAVREQEVVAEMANETASKLEEAGRPLVTLAARLQVRLGPDDPITTSFTTAATALNEMWRSLTLGYGPEIGRTPLKEQIEHAEEEFTWSMQRFVLAAVKRAGTVAMNGENEMTTRA
jgi:hypothetical protein